MNINNDESLRSSIIIKSKVLTTEIVDALQNDKLLKELYKKLSDIQSKSIPVIIQVSPTEYKTSYNDEVTELINQIHREINFRQDQILSFYDIDELELNHEK